MISAVKLFWFVQLSGTLCAQAQPLQGGMQKRYAQDSSLNSERDHINYARADLHSQDQDLGNLKRLQRSDIGGKPKDGHSLASSRVQTPKNSRIAPRSSVPIRRAPFYHQEEQQLNSPCYTVCDPVPNAYSEADETEQRRQELRNLVQHLYVAQARVQLEATEIRKAQAVASSAQAQLEDSANQVRSVTASLHTAQQEVAASAIRAQIAQLQLAAHDQLLFTARQDVDALSSQMVGLQAAEGIVQPKLTVDLHALLDKLKQPLEQNDHPTPVPSIVGSIPGMPSHQQQQQQQQQFQLQQQQTWQAQGQGQIPGQSRLPDFPLNAAKKKRLSNKGKYGRQRFL